MATVYLATDLRLERRVALKIMHGHLADDNAFKSRFVQEARSAARLAHPNVVNVFDQGQDADMAYLVMEYLPGMNLRDLLRDYGKLTPEQTLDILEAVLSGLAAAHKAGIVHRDLKPENVLLADDGRIKIGDFGLARAVSNNTATGQALLGTIAYLSPELVTRGIADARSDIYALGIMTYEMLTGEQPYVGEAPMQIAYQHANDSVPTPSSRVPSTPLALDELVLWATARDPEERPRDARVMLDRLHAVAGSVRAEAASTGPTRQQTMLLPSFDEITADAETQILGAFPPAAAGAVGEERQPDSSTVLATKARKRKRRGFWLFTLVVLMAALAGGTGWYFGAGPGSQVAVPTLLSATPEDAAAQLGELGLIPELGTEYSITVPQGLVASTDPGAGARVPKGGTVTLNVSQGPQPIVLPALAGLTVEAATRAVTDLKAAIGATDSVFDGSIPAGSVISATRESDGGDVSQGGDYFQGMNVNLVVSLGPVPDVAGKPVDEASAALTAVGLVPEPGEQTYSDDVPEGAVISASPVKEGPVRAGDTISLTVSRGPEPVEVPNVVGQTWARAKKALQEAGFSLDYNLAADLAPGLVRVSETDPAAGELVPKGTTIKVSF
ncbi:MAG: serine/threonine protein kinase [Cryobacterium sp.]|nr:serine/threonine protein kinase [Cryobacterium sp.]